MAALKDFGDTSGRYYFMERGDWAEYFLSALCKYEWNCLGGEPQLLEVRSMLNIALQNSSCEGDEFADRLYVVQSGHDSVQNPFLAFSNHKHSLGISVDCNKIEAFDFIKLGYKVEWLCLIITPSAISRQWVTPYTRADGHPIFMNKIESSELFNILGNCSSRIMPRRLHLFVSSARDHFYEVEQKTSICCNREKTSTNLILRFDKQ